MSKEEDEMNKEEIEIKDDERRRKQKGKTGRMKKEIEEGISKIRERSSRRKK
jgi:hypothetical protein